jgi:hypothetical protein
MLTRGWRKFSLAIVLVSFVVTPLPAIAGLKATVVQLKVTDVDAQQYLSRLIVTPDFLRFDDGKDESDFLLFDRKKKTIYNTSSQDETILVIRNHKIVLPKKSDWTHVVDTDNKKSPNVGGKTVKHWVLLTNNVVCYDLYAARDLLPEVTSALSEYRQVLATQQAEIYMNSPERKRDVCELANNVYLPDRYLKHGFPIKYRDRDGRGEEMVGYKEAVEVKPELFKLPTGFKEYSISGMR